MPCQAAENCLGRKLRDGRPATPWLASIVESAQDAIIGIQLDGTIVSWNRSAERLYGYESKEAWGQNLSMLFPNGSQEEYEKVLASLTHREGSKLPHTFRRAKSGSLLDLAIIVSPLMDDDGCVMGGSIIARDISKEIEIQKALRREVAVNSAVASLAKALISNDHDLTKLANLTCSHAKDLTTSTLGFVGSIHPETGELVNHTWSQLPIGESRDHNGGITPFSRQAAKSYHKGLANHPPKTNQPFFTNNLSMHPLFHAMPNWHVPIKRFLSVPVIYHNQLLGMIALANPQRDYSEYDLKAVRQLAKLHALALARWRHEEETAKLEEQLLQAQKMEVIGTLAGGIAHDFNNILAIIMGHLEMAQDEPGCNGMMVHLEPALKACERARTLVGHVMSFSRRGGFAGERTSLDILIQEALRFLRATIPATIDLKSKIRIPKGLPVTETSSVQLVLMNLCTNAAHAMREKGGVLEISLEVSSQGPELINEKYDSLSRNYLVLRVKDTGVGIPPKNLKKIFDPFFTTKGPGEGTGLGLATVKSMVDSLGGHVRVQSRPGDGSTFSVWLPVLKQDMRQGGQHRELRSIKGNELILYVDDEPALAELAPQMLGLFGYRVSVHTSAAEALKDFCARPGEFELVITDLNMPKMNGLQLAREIRRHEPEIPIILCTGMAEVVAEQILSANGVEMCVHKPCTPQELAKAIEETLVKAHNKYAAPTV